MIYCKETAVEVRQRKEFEDVKLRILNVTNSPELRRSHLSYMWKEGDTKKVLRIAINKTVNVEDIEAIVMDDSELRRFSSFRDDIAFGFTVKWRSKVFVFQWNRNKDKNGRKFVVHVNPLWTDDNPIHSSLY